MTTGGMPPTPARRLVLPALALTLLVALLSGYVVSRAVGREPTRCATFASVSAERLARDAQSVGRGPRVLVIGDSYSVGLGLDRPLESWPSRLSGHVRVAGFSGSGFSAQASPCGRVSYADRAAAAIRGGADVVVVEGGLNDWDASDREISRGFHRLMRELAGHQVGDQIGHQAGHQVGPHVLVVGPAAAPSRVSSVARVNGLLERLSGSHGATYLAMSSLDLPYLPDELHLTATGHDLFGDRVARELARLP